MLSCIDVAVYQPEFDFETDSYIDKNPFKRRSRRNQTIECRCKSGTSFTTYSSFELHIKGQTHKNFLQTYAKIYREADQHEQELKEFQIKYGKLELENRKLHKINSRLEKTISLRDLELSNLKEENKFLLGIKGDGVNEGDEGFEEDEEFQDCES